MEIDINIGRDVSGQGSLHVPATCERVSRFHAIAHWKDGTMTLEDKETPNGTFVNGIRIVRKTLKETDTVWLGGKDESSECYRLDVEALFKMCRDAEEEARTDYSKEFEELKQVYIDYQAEVAKVKGHQNVKMRIVNYVPMVAGLLFQVIPINTADPDSKLPMILKVLGIVIGIVVTLVLLSRSNKHDINEEITELQIKYKKLYKCPKCGKAIPLTTHWKILEADGKCPHGCGAEFVVKES